jgi:hypothetical protein
MAFGPPRRQRQQRIEPVQGLNRRLFVDAEHHRVLRGIEIETNHVRRLGLELGIRRAHVALQAMRLQASGAPRFGDDGVLHPKPARQRSRRPVCGPVWRRATRPRENAGLEGRRQDRRLRPAMPRGETRKAIGLEPALPQRDGPRTAAGLIGDAHIAIPVGQEQDHPRSSRGVRPSTARPLARLQLGPLVSRQHKSSRWHAPSYALHVVSTRH